MEEAEQFRKSLEYLHTGYNAWINVLDSYDLFLRTFRRLTPVKGDEISQLLCDFKSKIEQRRQDLDDMFDSNTEKLKSGCSLQDMQPLTLNTGFEIHKLLRAAWPLPDTVHKADPVAQPVCQPQKPLNSAISQSVPSNEKKSSKTAGEQRLHCVNILIKRIKQKYGGSSFVDIDKLYSYLVTKSKYKSVVGKFSNFPAFLDGYPQFFKLSPSRSRVALVTEPEQKSVKYGSGEKELRCVDFIKNRIKQKYGESSSVGIDRLYSYLANESKYKSVVGKFINFPKFLEHYPTHFKLSSERNKVTLVSGLNQNPKESPKAAPKDNITNQDVAIERPSSTPLPVEDITTNLTKPETVERKLVINQDAISWLWAQKIVKLFDSRYGRYVAVPFDSLSGQMSDPEWKPFRDSCKAGKMEVFFKKFPDTFKVYSGRKVALIQPLPL